MRTLILEALNTAFQAEVAHTYSITSREHDVRGGHAKAAQVLKTRIDNLLAYHDQIVDLVSDDTKIKA